MCGVIQLASQGLFWAKFPKQNRRVFLSVGEKTTKKEQQIVKLLWNENCWVLCNSFFFHKKFQRRLLILQVLQRKNFFLVSCKVLFNFPNNRYLPSRSERFSEQSEQKLKFPSRVVLNERVAGEKKKKFFLQNHDPRHSSKKTAEVISVLEPEKSAHKVQRHLKNDLLLFTPLKENLQS